MRDPLMRSEASILSPLRYPGAKRRLSGYIAETIKLNGLAPQLFVEPFAGGASVSLQLLNDGLVDQIALGEMDPLVASFWKIVFFDSDWLIEQIRNVNVTLTLWDRFRADPGSTDRDRAIACLFLNRTSFSGIIAPGAGPIGGRQQTSQYRLDCRFNPETLAKRIQQAARLSPRVRLVHCGSWKETLAKVRAFAYSEDSVLYYFDPPFYQRAERLYSHYFDERQHRELHDAVVSLLSPWILSYDPAEHIIALYADNGRTPRHVELLYSLRRSSTPLRANELIVTNLRRLPTKTRLWRTSQEWYGVRTPSTAGAHGANENEQRPAAIPPTGGVIHDE